MMTMPVMFLYRLSANRRAWSAPICFSTLTRPEYFPFAEAVRPGFMAGISGERETGSGHEFQCFPLFSVLLALDNPTVTLLSLDIARAVERIVNDLSAVRDHRLIAGDLAFFDIASQNFVEAR